MATTPQARNVGMVAGPEGACGSRQRSRSVGSVGVGATRDVKDGHESRGVVDLVPDPVVSAAAGRVLTLVPATKRLAEPVRGVEQRPENELQRG